MDKNDMEKEEDLDQSFLDNVLNKLYDFGDGSKRSRAQKKKKRKRCEEEEEMEVAATYYEGCHNEHTVEDRLSGGQHKERTVTNSPTAERTASDPPSKQKSEVEVITFQDPQKTARTQKTPAVPLKKTPPPIKETERDSKKEDSDKLSLEKSRFEVHRFGLTGYRKEQQRGFEVERAIMLGARPPKKEYVNYKVYQQTIKDKKQKAREQESTELKRNKKSSKPREEKKKRSGAAPSGLAGRFKNGMLVLNSKEIQKIKGAGGSQ